MLHESFFIPHHAIIITHVLLNQMEDSTNALSWYLSNGNTKKSLQNFLAIIKDISHKLSVERSVAQ